jgi:hypothetical protein
MSFRTDGFEPSAYTIPPPRPAGRIILPQLTLYQSIQCATAVTRIWLKCHRDWRRQSDQ